MKQGDTHFVPKMKNGDRHSKLKLLKFANVCPFVSKMEQNVCPLVPNVFGRSKDEKGKRSF